MKSISYKYLMPIVMLYITVDLASLVYSYKEIHISFIIGMASSIIFPLTYIIGDVVTEVYGYRIAKSMIWYGIMCDFVFATLTYLVSLTPSPSSSQHDAYYTVLSPLLRAITAQTIGICIGAYTNIHLMSRWKTLLNGKHFWLRSIGSSIIGEGLALIISVLIALGGILPTEKILFIILYAYIYKMIFAVLIAPVGQVAAHTIREFEHPSIEMNNYDLDPFKTH